MNLFIRWFSPAWTRYLVHKFDARSMEQVSLDTGSTSELVSLAQVWKHCVWANLQLYLGSSLFVDVVSGRGANVPVAGHRFRIPSM